ncbi:MAG: polysaccharide pyruvyl transferase family protein [Faecousia sp.]
MKILLIGEYYSENLGDPLLCQSVERILKEQYPEAEIIPFDLSGRTGSTEYYEPKPHPAAAWIEKQFSDRYLYYRRAAILRAYEQDKDRCLRVWDSLGELLRGHRFDLAVFAGGSLFMDYFAGVIHLVLRRLALTRTKILFHACGMSTLDEDGVYLLRQVLCSRQVVSISLRDSYERFTELFPVKARVRQTCDTALNCSRWFPKAAQRRAEFGIGMIDRCYDQQLRLIKSCMASGRSWMAFTNGSPYDQKYAENLLTDAGIPAEKLGQYLAARPRTTEDLIRTVTGFDKIIAFRMHSQIAAASFGIPSFGIAWDGKLTEFYRKLGFPQGCTEEVPDFSQIEEVLAQYDETLHARALKQGQKSRDCLTEEVERALNLKR